MSFQIFYKHRQGHRNDHSRDRSSCTHTRAWQALLDACCNPFSPSQVISTSETDIIPAIVESQFVGTDRQTYTIDCFITGGCYEPVYNRSPNPKRCQTQLLTSPFRTEEPGIVLYFNVKLITKLPRG